MALAMTQPLTPLIPDPTAHPLPTNALPPQRTSLLRLPVEIRRMILLSALKYDCLESRVNSSLQHAIYYEILQNVWNDRPTPLLFVNRQIHHEVSDILQRNPATLRVTGQGMSFDNLGQSVCIARNIRQDLSKIPQILVEIWPPRADRPIDMLYIWQHLRRLKNALAKYPQIQKLTLQFVGNRSTSWTKKGRLRRTLPFNFEFPDDFPGGTRVETTDVKAVLDLFRTLTNVDEAIIGLPSTLSRHRVNENLRLYADRIEDIMEDIKIPAKELSTLELWPWYDLEATLQRDTAAIALKKLNRITQCGKHKMSQQRYRNIMSRWPYMEWLGPLFKGQWHYVAGIPAYFTHSYTERFGTSLN